MGRAITSTEVKTVQQFLTNLPERWPKMQEELKNELFNALLQAIVIDFDPGAITARVVWSTGLVQEIEIYRPLIDKRRRWTDEEIAILQQHYADSDPAE